MTSLVGWWAGAVRDLPPRLILNRMVRCGLSRNYRVAEGEHTALAIDGMQSQCDLSDNGDILSAIAGDPRWDDEHFARFARDNGHAAALREAYLRHGEGLFHYLKGSFALAIVIRSPARILIAIDRLGIQPMYYAQPTPGAVVFGSTADLVRAHPAVKCTVSDQSLFNYLFFTISPSPGTIYSEQFKLLPAQCVVFERNRVKKSFYWAMPYREDNEDSPRALGVRMMELLRRATKRCIDSVDHSAVGAFLSGGLDSSTVVGLASEQRGGPIDSFTIGFAQDRYDETRYAEIAARHFGATHHAYILRPCDVVDVLPKLAQKFDEPFGNSSVVPSYYCAKQAREFGKDLLLAGDGGDELFAGNSRYVDQKLFDYYGRIPRAIRQLLIEPLTFRSPLLGQSRLGRRAISYVRRALTPMPERTEGYNFYCNNDLANIFAPDALAAIDPQEPLSMLREVYERATSGAMLQRMLHLDLKITLADNDLRKVGKACELAELDVRYPFLDEDVVEFSASIPPEMLIKGLERRWFFRQAVSDFLAPETLSKRKHGFGMPFAEWTREDPGLREVAVDCMRGFARRGYLRQDFIERLIGGEVHIEQGLAWDVMMIELWFRERDEASLASEGTMAGDMR